MWSLYGEAEQAILRHFEQVESDLSRKDHGRWARAAWSAMVLRVMTEQVEVTGHLNGQHVATVIGAGLLASGQPDFQAQTITTDIGTFSGVLVLPAPGPLASVPVETSSTFAGKGGRKPLDVWPEFIREVVRVADLDGLTTRRELTEYMKTWCAERWPSPPSDDAIRKKVIDLWPEGKQIN